MSSKKTSRKLIKHLEECSKIVSKWPKWKQEILGGKANMEHTCRRCGTNCECGQGYRECTACGSCNSELKDQNISEKLAESLAHQTWDEEFFIWKDKFDQAGLPEMEAVCKASQEWMDWLKEKHKNEDWKCPYVKKIAEALDSLNRKIKNVNG